MTRANASLLPQTLRRVLQRYRRRWRVVNLQRGLFLTLGALAASVGLAVLADRLLRLEPTLRAVALAGIGILFLACLVRWVIWPVALRISDRDAAIRVGRHFPKMEEDLVSAVELSTDAEKGEGISHSLVVAVLARIAGRAVGKVDHRAAVSLRPMFLTITAFLVVAAAFLAAYLARPEAVENALARLFQPNRPVPFFSYTQLQVRPGDMVIRTGDIAAVAIGVSGRVPETALLEARSGGGALRAALACAEGQAEWRSGALFEDLTYRVSAGDALSEWYRVRVVPPPALRNKSAILYDPAYAGGDEHAVESIQGPLEIVQGTAVVLRGAPVARGEDLEFRCQGELKADGERLALKPDASGLLSSPRFVPTKSAEYGIVLKDGFGLESRAPDGVYLKVVPDAVPQVAITEPARDLLILPGERVEVSAEARDEFGMRGLAMCQRKVKKDEDRSASAADPRSWERKTLKDGGVRTRTLSAKAELDIVAMGLVAGDSLEYMAEASDYAGDAVQRRGASRVYRATLMSEAEHQELMMNRLRDLQAELLRRAAEQRAEAAKVGDLGAKAAKASVADAAMEAKGRETALARSTDSVAKKFEALIPEMARNPTTPTDSLSELERLGRAVSSVANGQMASASKSLGEASQAKEGEQSPSISQAQKQESEAAERLENLARAAERLQRTTVLGKLAADAERLAARQRELKESAANLAPKTVARKPEELPPDLKGALERLTAGEQSVKTGTDALGNDIQRAAGALSFSAPAQAEIAKEAGAKLETDKTADKAGELAREMQKNVLFSPLPKHDEVASSLSEVAKMLRREAPSDPMETITKELEEFIRRQREVNTQSEDAIGKTATAPTPSAHGAKQAGLGRDVSEQASALEYLAQEIEGFESATAARLTGASTEMKSGAADLYAAAFPDGLEHGRRALALLEEARKKFGDESGQMASAAQARQSLAALLLLQKILTGQKQVNRGTAAADEGRTENETAFNRNAADLAQRQSGLRVDARRLQDMLAQYAGAADVVGKSGEKMDVSRLALLAGDMGKDTRIVQRQIVALLEALIADQKNRMGSGMSLAQMRTMAMMQMLAQSGMSPGGFAGGTNAPILPATIGKAEGEEWRKVRSRFEQHLSEGLEEVYPAQFRGLLNAYFDRLRKEPPR